MSLEHQPSGKELLTLGFYRGSVNRSYYAAYCAVTNLLQDKVDFAYVGNNPGHSKLPNLILNNLGKIDVVKRRDIRQAVSGLWAGRVNADYNPSSFFDQPIALALWRDATFVLAKLGVTNE